MKNFAKFIPVALGLLTLASCSSDDLFSGKTVAEEAQPGDLYVTMEDLQEDGSVFTRSYIDANTNTASRKYVPLDELRVYDNDLHKYDIYAFTWTDKAQDMGVFRRWNTTSNITSPKWALYPKENVTSGSWTYNEETNFTYTTVTMNIPATMDYNATYSLTDTEFKTPLYKDVLPRWGAVTSVNDGDKLQASLNYMTGVLRLSLAGIPDYAKFVLVKMFVGGVETNQIVMNGDFTTTIAKADNPDPNAMLTFKETSNAWSAKTGIRVALQEPADLVGTAKKHGVLYVPLVTTVDPTTGKSTTVDIVCYIPVDKSAVDPNVTIAGQWKEIKRFENKKIERAKLYGNKSEMNLAVDGGDIEAINDALELSKPDNEGTVKLTATNPNGIEVCSSSSPIHNVLEIPNTPGVTSYVIDLSTGLYACGTTDQLLTIVDKDPGNPFTGNVMLIGKAKSGKKQVTLDVQLPSAAVFGFAGDALSTASSPFATSRIDAKAFQLGDTKTFTTYNPLRFVMSDNVKTVNVSENAVFNGDLTIDPTSYQGVTAVNVDNGQIAGDIDASAAANPVNITATGDAATVTGDITTKGDVTIESKFAGFKNVTADGAISISSEAKAKYIESKESTVTLTDKVQTWGVKAKGNIVIDKQVVNIASEGIVSSEGNISISNEFDAAKTQTGVITATKGSVSLNAGGKFAVSYPGVITAGQDVKLSGKVITGNNITAGNDFEITGDATSVGATSIISVAHTAKVNVTTAGGDVEAIAGALTFVNGSDYALELLSGYVKKVDSTDGEVTLTFWEKDPSNPDEIPPFTAIAEVTTPDNLKAQGESVWNGKKMDATLAGTYVYDGALPNIRIWTATQLAMQQGDITAETVVDLRSNINLNNEEWEGINATANYTIEGKGHIISNVKIIGNRPELNGGFFNHVGVTGTPANLTVNNLTFDGVQTEISAISAAEVYGNGIGAVVGQMTGNVEMTRVNVKLAGTNFGSDGVDNLTTRNVGGFIGLARGDVKLTGVTIDANGAKLTGYRNMGGFIGGANGKVEILLAEKDKAKGLPMVKPTATGVAFTVTYNAVTDLGKTNDKYQGSLGWFIGYFTTTGSYNATIDVAAEAVDLAINADGKWDETKAFEIGSGTHRWFFHRENANYDDINAFAHQTLIGNSGYEKETGIIRINGTRFEIDKDGVGFTSGSKRLYTVKDEPHI